MFKAVRHRMLAGLFKVIRHLEEKELSLRLERDKVSILIFFHGFDSVSAHRSLVVGTTLRRRGYTVEFAGAGSFSDQFRQEDFTLHDLATPIPGLGSSTRILARMRWTTMHSSIKVWKPRGR